MSPRNSAKTTKYDCPESHSGNKYGPRRRSPSMLAHTLTNVPDVSAAELHRIDLEPHMAIVYPIMIETCFLSPQYMCNETIICVLLLQQLFTEGHAFLTVIWFQTLHGCMVSQTVKACAQYFYLKSSHGLMHGCLIRASFLSGAVLHPPVLPSGRSAVFQYREDWLLAIRFRYFAV
ncbi:uncharacterized protein TNIN_414691 [Trichonephila inaurata madagascariensis]|uniref:Uncharacterized protein n=1 Tax=Trichonephila inaurata madagascariensis TaxID=2747483 RepID=A0A8X6XT53_9ARAC|nr:uncharacterized protein TNIN_414691 [Trichonephila inaurata madagascariensis]